MFKQRKNKSFNYQPRFSKENQTEADLNTHLDTKDFVSKWKKSNGAKVKTRGAMSMKLLILILVLLLICMYLLEKRFM